MRDKQLIFCTDLDISQIVGDYIATDYIDMGAVGSPALGGTPVRDWGRNSRPLQVEALITQTVTSAGAATIQAQLVMADDNAGTNLVVLQETPAIALATLVAGYRFALGFLPPGISKRYLGVRFAIAGATTTAGLASAALVETKQLNPYA